MHCRLTRSIGLAAVLATAAGCGGTTSSGTSGAFKPSGRFGDATTTVPTTPARDPSAIPAQEVDRTALAQYRAYQKAYQRVYETFDTTPLPTVATDPLLSIIIKDVQDTEAKGRLWRFVNVLNPKVRARSKDNQKVVVLDCVYTLSSASFSTTTGERLSYKKGGTRYYQVVMQYDSGTWKVSQAQWGNKC